MSVMSSFRDGVMACMSAITPAARWPQENEVLSRRENLVRRQPSKDMKASRAEQRSYRCPSIRFVARVGTITVAAVAVVSFARAESNARNDAARWFWPHRLVQGSAGHNEGHNIAGAAKKPDSASELRHGPVPRLSVGSVGDSTRWSHDSSAIYLVAVLSARENAVRRATVRNEWAYSLAKLSIERHRPTNIFFIVGNNGCIYNFSKSTGSYCGGGSSREFGTSRDEVAEDMALMAEQDEHHDIIFVNAKDVYEGSSAKLIEFYRLLHASGMKYEALIKMDDDSALLPVAFFNAMDSVAPPLNGIETTRDPKAVQTLHDTLVRPEPRWLGNFRINEWPQRKADMAWTISKERYPANIFPPFAAGTTHMLNYAFGSWLGANADSILDTSVWMEDVAHGIWFDQLARQSKVPACRLVDARMPPRQEMCAAESFAIGSLANREQHHVIHAVYQALEVLRVANKFPEGSPEKAAGMKSYYQSVRDNHMTTFPDWIKTCGRSMDLGADLPKGLINRDLLAALNESIQNGESINFPIEVCGPMESLRWCGRPLTVLDPLGIRKYGDQKRVHPWNLKKQSHQYGVQTGNYV